MERAFGRIIQRTTLDCIIGVKDASRREERKDGSVVVGVSESRWRVQRGIFAVQSCDRCF